MARGEDAAFHHRVEHAVEVVERGVEIVFGGVFGAGLEREGARDGVAQGLPVDAGDRAFDAHHLLPAFVEQGIAEVLHGCVLFFHGSNGLVGREGEGAAEVFEVAEVVDLSVGFQGEHLHHPGRGFGAFGEAHLLAAQGGDGGEVGAPKPRLGLADAVEEEDGNLAVDGQQHGVGLQHDAGGDGNAGEFARGCLKAGGSGFLLHKSIYLPGDFLFDLCP